MKRARAIRLRIDRDGVAMVSSELTTERQTEIEPYLRVHLGPDRRIHFRKLGSPKAFALAMAFHEVAHLKQRHVLSTIVSSSALAMLSMFLVGDMVGMTDSARMNRPSNL